MPKKKKQAKTEGRLRRARRLKVPGNDREYVLWGIYDKGVSLLASDVSLFMGPDPDDKTACLEGVDPESIIIVR